jgi:hypothetical protein
MALTTVNPALLDTQAQYTGFKNRIINGAMVISQRNAGASVTLPAASTYTTDRWNIYSAQASKLSAQQNAGSVTPPAGFTNYLGITSLSAYSVTASDEFLFRQPIEGYNVSDLGFGTAGASTATLSFRVYSSLTGTFGGSLQNVGATRSYPFSYSIPVANTWTTISVTIAGDTAGTWPKTNGNGLYVVLGLGVGSTYSGTAGAWVGSCVNVPTGSVSVVGTSGATFYITGVQLEKGSTATAFDYRPYGTELALCQRYYETSFPPTIKPAPDLSGYAMNVGGIAYTGSNLRSNWFNYKVNKRAASTITLYAPRDYGTTTTGNSSVIYISSSWYVFSDASPAPESNVAGFVINGNTPVAVTTAGGYLLAAGWSASSEL